MKVLVPTSGATSATETANYVMQVAQAMNAELIVLHVIKPGHASEAGELPLETFQIAANTETNIMEIAGRIATLLKDHGIQDIGIDCGDARVGDVMRNYADIRKASERLQWIPTNTLDEGLKKTLGYFLDEIGDQKA